MSMYRNITKDGMKSRRKLAATFILTVSTMLSMMGGCFADAALPANTTTSSTVGSTILPGGCYPQPQCKSVVLNGRTLTLDQVTKPYRSDSGELMIPLKRYAQDLGMKVTWKAAEKAVELEGNDLKIKIPVGDNQQFKTNGMSYRTQVSEGRLYVPYHMLVDVMGCVAVETTDNGLIMDSTVQQIDEAATIGEIADVIQGKDGVQILVKGQAEGKFGLNEISLAVGRLIPVTVTQNDGSSSASKVSDLKKGDMVYVKYGKAVTRSMPALGQAISVEVLKDCFMMTGKVYEVTPATDGKGSYSIHVIGRTDYILHLDPKITIWDEKGNVLTIKDIKAGQLVRAIIAQYSTMSMPPQTTAYKLVVVQ